MPNQFSNENLLTILEKDVEKKRGRIAHPEKTSQTNSVTELGEKCSQPMVCYCIDLNFWWNFMYLNIWKCR